MKAAILDDNISFCKSLENYLSKYHFDISIYTNYNDLKNHIDSFDLLFLDIEMPNISGIDIAQSLSYKHLDIIFFQVMMKWSKNVLIEMLLVSLKKAI